MDVDVSSFHEEIFSTPKLNPQRATSPSHSNKRSRRHFGQSEVVFHEEEILDLKMGYNDWQNIQEVIRVACQKMATRLQEHQEGIDELMNMVSNTADANRDIVTNYGTLPTKMINMQNIVEDLSHSRNAIADEVSFVSRLIRPSFFIFLILPSNKMSQYLR